MSTPPSNPPPVPPQPVPTEWSRGWSAGSAAVHVPAQRQASPEPPTPPAPVGSRRWPWAVGGLALGLLIGAAVAGGSRTGPATVAAPATAAPPRTVYVTVPAPAPPATTITVEVPPPPPPTPVGPLTSFSDGVYEVGPDIVPGKYKTPGPGSTDIFDSCYMEVGDGSGSLSGIDQNDNLTGPGVVTLKAGKNFKVSGGCTWTKVG